MNFADDVADFRENVAEHFIRLDRFRRKKFEHRDRRADAEDGKRKRGYELRIACRDRER